MMAEGNGQLARIYSLERRQDTVEPTVRQLEKDVAVIRRDVAEIARDISAMRSDSERRAERETTTARWRIGIAISVVGAILAAAAIVSNAIQAGVVP